MDSIHSYQEDNKQTTMDSFEINLKQIEQTNKLLDNIEFKLSDFFAKKSLNENFHTPYDSNKKNHDLPKLYLEESTSNQRLNSSPSSVHYKPSAQAQGILGGLGGRGSGLLTFGTAEQLRNHLKNASGENLHTHFSRASCDEQFQSTASQQRFSAHDDIPIRGSVRNDSIDRMLELEDCYQSKIGLLQNRIKSSETEMRKLKVENKKLTMELNTIRKTIGMSREQFLQELKTALYEQEVRLTREFADKAAAKEEMIMRLSQENMRLNQENATLKSDYETLFQKNEKLMTAVQETEREQASLLDKYQNLMSIQNEMIHLDVQRNGRFSSDTSSFLHFSNQKDLKENKPDDNRVEIRAFMENIELYRKELEDLKCNNFQIKEQFQLETARIKADLKQQKDQNAKLIEQLKQQQSMNQQLTKVVELQSKLTVEKQKEKLRNEYESSASSKTDRLSTRGLLDSCKEIFERGKENMNCMNIQEQRHYPGENEKLLDTINDSANFPFTNPQIKSSWSKGRKSVPKMRTLDKPEQTHKRKEGSQPKTARLVHHKSEKVFSGLSTGLEEELRKLKAHVSSKIPDVDPPRRLSVKATSNTARLKSSKLESGRERSGSVPRRRLY